MLEPDERVADGGGMIDGERAGTRAGAEAGVGAAGDEANAETRICGVVSENTVGYVLARVAPGAKLRTMSCRSPTTRGASSIQSEVTNGRRLLRADSNKAFIWSSSWSVSASPIDFGNSAIRCCCWKTRVVGREKEWFGRTRDRVKSIAQVRAEAGSETASSREESDLCVEREEEGD